MATQVGTGILLMRDGEGNFYTVPKDVLDQYRVPAERATQAKGTINTDDVSGYYWPGGWGGYNIWQLESLGYWPDIDRWEYNDYRWGWFGGRDEWWEHHHHDRD